MTIRKQPRDVTCIEDECNDPVFVQAYRKDPTRDCVRTRCEKHYKVFAGRHVVKIPEGLDRVGDHGYIVTKLNGKHLAKHKVVMEQHLGRALTKYESVHHKNGIRNDNSIDNLELWVGGIRYGQRASDIHCWNCGESYNQKAQNAT